MVCTKIPGYAFLGFLLIATPALARVVISEVLWMGSDQSTADEWVEAVGVDDGVTTFPLSLSGWTLTSLRTDEIEKTLVRFGNVSIDVGQYRVVSNYPAEQSRLALDPVLTTTAMTLPNTKLLLRLRDASGAIVDEVDDGVGVPFAGSNPSTSSGQVPSGTGAKASMERVDLLAPGNMKENWQTAIVTLGFDLGVPIFGTPGFPRASSVSSRTSSSVPLATSSSLSSVEGHSSSQTSDVGSVSVASSFKSFSSFLPAVAPSGAEAGASFSSSSCIPNISNIRIALQSGEARSEGKVTVNLQLLWDGKGTLRCTWNYGDSFTSTSCNPPSHTFSVPGTYEVQVEGEDVCGGKTVQMFPIEVLAVRGTGVGRGGAGWRASGSSSSLGLCVPRTFAGVEIVRFLPNPEGSDGTGEWIELRNTSDRVAVLCDWVLDDAEGGSAPFALNAVTLAPKEIRRFPASVTGLGLNNDEDHLRLFAPGDRGHPLLVQDISYTNARDGIVMDALLPTQGINGRVVHVIDGDTVTVRIADREVTVRLLGIDAPEPTRKGEEGQWGQKATEFLRGLLEGGMVSLNFDQERQDVYGRILAYLSIGGHDVQAELLRQGLASVYERCTCVRKEEYVRLEEEARQKRVGMWGGGTVGNVSDEIPSPLGGGSSLRPAFAEATAGKQGYGRQVVRGGRKVLPGSRKEEKNEGMNVFLSEVYPVPLPAEEEWVELWNGGGEPTDLSGWKIDDGEEGGSRAWEFPGGFILQPGVFIVLRSDQTHLAFNNDGDSVALLTLDGRVINRMAYGKLRRGSAFARVIQRMGNTGEFRATDRFCITNHPTPFERNICEEELSSLVSAPAFAQKATAGKQGDVRSSVPSKVRRVVRLARRVKYRNVLSPDASGSVTTPPDPLFTELLAHMERSVQSGQVVWGEGDEGDRVGTVSTGGTVDRAKRVGEWEAIFLPFLLVIGVHWMLSGMWRIS